MEDREAKILYASVPEKWKSATSPIGAAQSYIAELEQMLMAVTGEPFFEEAYAAGERALEATPHIAPQPLPL